MKLRIHDGLTQNPHATLPDGSPEISLSRLAKHLLAPAVVANQLRFKSRRKKLATMSQKEKEFFCDPMLPAFAQELTDLILGKKKAGKVAAVLAPWYEDNTLSKSEGYIRRIMEIDGRVLKDVFCVYFYECPYFKVDQIVVDKVGDNRLYVRYNTAYKEQREFVESIIALCDFCYSHSVLRVIPMENPEDESRWLNIFEGNTKHILDAHGAVVEEALLKDDSVVAEYCRKAEALYFKHVSACVVLTDSMRRYYEERYGCGAGAFFKTPVLSQDITTREGEKLDKSGPLTAVYAGGCQKWQNIPLMQAAIRSRQDVTYNIFVSAPEAFMQAWGDEPLPENVRVKNGTPEEIKEAYLTAHYGFILRDDNPLNWVACPTKMMEYIQFGIIPVVKSFNIGDFREMGLKMLAVEDFSKGEATYSEADAMKNKDVANQLHASYFEALASIKEAIGAL